MDKQHSLTRNQSTQMESDVVEFGNVFSLEASEALQYLLNLESPAQM
jgi:hypothetical protein